MKPYTTDKKAYPFNRHRTRYLKSRVKRVWRQMKANW